jgi:hypothetical protein
LSDADRDDEDFYCKKYEKCWRLTKEELKLILSVWHVVACKSDGFSAEPALVVDVINVPRNFNSRIKL